MKTIITILTLLVCGAKADVIVSIAVKQSVVNTNEVNTTTNNSTTVNNNTTNTTTNNCTKNGKHCTTTTTSSTTSSSKAPISSTESSFNTNKAINYDAGLLVQYLHSNSNIVLGVGYFKDNTGLISLGMRFK